LNGEGDDPMREINVYAYHSDFGALCRDATLDKANGLSYPSGNQQGQAGWHIAIRFESLSDLARKLTSKVPMPKEFCGQWFKDCEPIERGEIARLALMAHGDQGGAWAPNGKERETVTAANVPSYHADLHTIGLFTNEQSTVLLMGCLSAQGELGTKLLGALSRVWTHRTIVGFTTIGYRHSGAMKRPGEACELPGMRETDATAPLYVDSRYKEKLGSMWNDFEKLPWASEKSLHVKVVKDGAVVRCPNDELCAPPTPPQKGKRQPPRQGGRR
jgi:hypothetical protein